MAGLLQPLKWMTHSAQLEQVSGYDAFGNVSTTNVVTMSCLAYQDSVEDTQQPNMSSFAYKSWFLLIPNTVAATVGNHVKSVIDSLGNTVIPNAIVKQVDDYHHWNHGSRFRILMLDVSKNG